MPRTFTDKVSPTEETAKVPQAKIDAVFTGTIHEVHILDGSGSMFSHYQRPDKFTNGSIGITADLSTSKEQSGSLGLNTTYSICQFGSNYNTDIEGNVFMQPIASFNGYNPRGLRSGSTYLYGTIIDVITSLLALKKQNDKVLLKITTDGQDNASTGRRLQCAQLLRKVQDENNFTVTFVGTKNDVDLVTNNLNVDASNTLVYDNTSDGLRKALMKTESASVSYRSAVTRGEDVSMNFYSKSL
jgi:hypothetical protein